MFIKKRRLALLHLTGRDGAFVHFSQALALASFTTTIVDPMAAGPDSYFGKKWRAKNFRAN